MNDLMLTSKSADDRRGDWLKVGQVQVGRKLPVTPEQASHAAAATQILYIHGELILLLTICLNYLDADGLCFFGLFGFLFISNP